MKTIRENSRFADLANEEEPIRAVVRERLKKFNNDR